MMKTIFKTGIVGLTLGALTVGAIMTLKNKRVEVEVDDLEQPEEL